MTFVQTSALLALLPLLYVFGTVIYNLYFHPLRHYPGPLLWRATRLRWSYAFITGRLHNEQRRLHEQYGPLLRIAPDELSFIDPSAWTDIHAYANSRKFMKCPNAYVAAPNSSADHILIANDSNHARFRRCLSHAFSDKALREQTGIVRGHVDLLVKRLRERMGQSVDLVKWYNFATFDIIGDLAFGSSFGCLEASDYHPWVSLIFASIKTSGILSIIRRYVPTKVLYALIPTSAIQKIEDHRAMTTAKVQQRLATQTDRADFLSYILRHSTIDENSKDSHDGKGMSVPEITANSSLLIMAGSETTATALSGVTYLLLRNPAVLRKLTEEIRRRFKKEDEMTLSALGSCDYLNCVLKEGMRMYPPVALGLPRKVVQEEVTIAGNVVPKGSIVAVPQWASYYSPTHFSNSSIFDPTRWSGTGDGDLMQEVHTPAAFNPFSLGPRNCIGQNLAWMEMRLILARVLWNFELELVDDAFDPERQAVYVLWSKPALNVKLHPRVV